MIPTLARKTCPMLRGDAAAAAVLRDLRDDPDPYVRDLARIGLDALPAEPDPEALMCCR